MTTQQAETTSVDLFDDLFDIDAQADADSHVTSHELAIARSKFGDLLDLMPAGLLIHQEQGVVYANREAQRIFGTDGQSLVGRHVFDFVADQNLPAVRGLFSRCLTLHEQVRAFDCVMTSLDGGSIHVQLSMSILPWEGLPVLYVLINDVDALKKSEAALRRLSITDSLTGAFNRRHYLETARRELERARRHDRPLSVLLMDIDHFKKINDVHGHLSGDEALRRFVQLCQRQLRAGDVLGRIGGEEFAVLVPDADLNGAVRLAERIRAAVEGAVVDGERGGFRMTVSIGVCGGGVSACLGVDDLLSRADKALYQAKNSGRNRVESLPPPAGASDVAA